MSEDVVIFSTRVCPYCVKAKNWFTDQGFVYQEVILETQEAIEEYKKAFPGKKTVPQILVKGEAIGGFDDLVSKAAHVKSLLAA
jgi:glutaredoxin 3